MSLRIFLTQMILVETNSIYHYPLRKPLPYEIPNLPMAYEYFFNTTNGYLLIFKKETIINLKFAYFMSLSLSTLSLKKYLAYILS